MEKIISFFKSVGEFFKRQWVEFSDVAKSPAFVFTFPLVMFMILSFLPFRGLSIPCLIVWILTVVANTEID